jgi:hypothetical protein
MRVRNPSYTRGNRATEPPLGSPGAKFALPDSSKLIGRARVDVSEVKPSVIDVTGWPRAGSPAFLQTVLAGEQVDASDHREKSELVRTVGSWCCGEHEESL